MLEKSSKWFVCELHPALLVWCEPTNSSQKIVLTLSCLRRKLDANTNLQQANTQKTLKPISFQSREIFQKILNPRSSRSCWRKRQSLKNVSNAYFIFASGDFLHYVVHKICERDIIPSKQSTFEFFSIPLTPCVWRTWTTQCCGGSRSGSTCGFPAPQIVVALFSSCSGSSTTNSARERFHVVQSQQSTKIWMNEDKQRHGVQMHQMHTSVYKNCSTSYAPKISKYQNTNSKYFLCRYTQNIRILTQVPHCADAPKILKY